MSAIKKILLIEDDQPKQELLVDFIMQKQTSSEVAIARSINAAVKLLDTGDFNSILLDMSLPTFDESGKAFSGGRQQNFGGRQLLTYMLEMEMHAQVFMLTQFRDFEEDGKIVDLVEIDRQLKSEFSDIYCGYAHFHLSDESWKDALLDFLERG